MVGARAVVGAVEDREVLEARRRRGATRRTSPRGRLPLARAGKDTSGLIEAYWARLWPSCWRLKTQPASLIRSRDRWIAGTSVRMPAMKMLAATAKSAQRSGTRDRDVIEDRPGPRPRLGHQGQGPAGQRRGGFGRGPIVQQQRNGAAQTVDARARSADRRGSSAPSARDRALPAGPARNRSSGRRSWRQSFPSRLAVRAISWSFESAA